MPIPIPPLEWIPCPISEDERWLAIAKLKALGMVPE